MRNVRKNKLVEIRVFVLLLFLCLTFYAFARSHFQSNEAFALELNEKKTTLVENDASIEQAKYSGFPHSKHRQACHTCHKFPSPNWKRVRPADQAFPDVTDYPKHDSCLSCHRKQFFGTPKPVICQICHTNPSPKNSNRYPFPNPREIFDKTEKGKNAVSDFAIHFSHEKHLELLGKNESDKKVRFINAKMKRAGEESCAMCHQNLQPQGESDDEYVSKPPKDWGNNFWLKKGTFKSIPIGHTNCFTCHSADSGIEPTPNNCAACHQTKPALAKTDFDKKFAAPMKIDDKILLMAWRNRDSSATFRHEFVSHAELECATCHTVSTMDTLKIASKKVSINACAICHVTATLDDGGVLNYEVDERRKDAKFQCTKCHIAFGSEAIPATHLKAIEEAGE